MMVWDSTQDPAVHTQVVGDGYGADDAAWAGSPYPVGTTAGQVARWQSGGSPAGGWNAAIDSAVSGGSGTPPEEVPYGFEDMPGATGYTVGTGDNPSQATPPTYKGSANYDVWKTWGERRIIRQKKKLWLAGYYKDQPIFNGGIDQSDMDAMREAMAEANLNGKTWEDQIAPRVQKGIELGGPYDPADTAVDGGAAGASDAAQQRVLFSTSKAQLRTLAANNGVKLPHDYVQKMAHQIAKGSTTYEVVSQEIRNRTIAETYPAYADRIKAGEDLVDIAQPYRQAYMNILEEEPDMRDPALQRALQAVNENGKPTTVPLWQFEQQLKEDPRWAKTDNAWEEVGGRTMALMQMFGMQP